MRRSVPILLVLCAGLVQADVTIRYTSDFKGSLGAMTQAHPQLQSLLPKETTLRIKGSKSYVEYGTLRAITDSSTKKVILLDPDGKKYAITNTDEYVKAAAGALPKLPDNMASLMSALQFKTDSKVTGDTATIQGIESEERQVDISMEAPAGSNLPPGPLLKVAMQIWTSQESEADHNPALREWAAYNQSALFGTSPTDSLKKLFAALPGVANGLSGALQDTTKPNSVIMRVHMELFMPGIAAALKQMPPGKNPLGADFDPNAPIVEADQQVTEISSEAVPDSQFDVPKDYTQETVDQYMKDLMVRFTPAGAGPVK